MKEKEAHIRESTILKNKVFLSIFFNPCKSTFHMTYHFISDETCGYIVQKLEKMWVKIGINRLR